MRKATIHGYCDRLSVAPGEPIEFKVSCEEPGTYRADVVRLVHGDTNPAGPGFKEEVVETDANGDYDGRLQPTDAGSCIVVEDGGALALDGAFTLHAFVMPTTPGKARSGDHGPLRDRVASGLRAHDRGRRLWRSGSEARRSRRGSRSIPRAGTRSRPRTTAPARSRCTRARSSTRPTACSARSCRFQARLAAPTPSRRQPGDAGTAFTIAGLARESGSTWVDSHLNGKVDRPRVWNRALSEEELDAVTAGGEPPASGLVAAWDFADGIGPSGIPTDHVTDRGPGGLHGTCVNFPARAMTGWNWRGIEEVFRHAPEQYGAIHFHEDDLEDCRWETDISLDACRTAYAAAATRCGSARARPRTGCRSSCCRLADKATAKALFLVPTASYLAYANEHIVHDVPVAQAILGHTSVDRASRTSTSTATPSSASRPTTPTRTAAASTPPPRSGPSSTCGRSSAWRRARSGSSRPISISSTGSTRWASSTTSPPIASCTTRAPPCSSATTSSSPAPTPSTTRARCSTRGRRTSPAGGRGMYLGSNGFYWIIAWHPEKPGLIEVRKGEYGSRAWQARPGEYSMQLNGERSGLWRGRSRAPQKVFGTGFTAEGFDHASYYVQLPDARDPACAFIMDGIGPDEKIGDFGLVGGGAAGYELDRYDLLRRHSARDTAARLLRGPLGQLPARRRGDLLQLPGHGRHGRLPGAGRHHLLHDEERRRRLLDELDLLVREPLAQRLRQQRLADDRQRPPPLHGRRASPATG